MKVVVLGASGFLGRHVVPALVQSGNHVLAIARSPPPAAERVQPLAADVLERDWEKSLAGADALVNLVGVHHGHGRQSFEAIHVELAQRIVAATRSANVTRLVHVSVQCARADSHLAYHDSKFRGEEHVRQSGLRWTILRPGIVFAADDAFTTRIRRQLAQRVAPIPGSGNARQAPVHADDLAAAIARSLELSTTEGRILPLSGARTLGYAQIVDELAQHTGHRVWMPHFPLALLRFVARLTRGFRNPPLSEGQLAMIAEGMAADSNAIWHELQIAPRGFEDAQLA